MIAIRARLATLLLCSAAFAVPVFAADVTAPPEADNPAYMWDLTDVYASPEAWTAAHDKLKAQADALDKYKGTLGQNAGAMLTALSTISDVQKETNRLMTYAGLKGDENLKDSAAQERRQAGNTLATEVSEKTAWVAPEILVVGADKVHAFEQQSPELTKRFAFYLDNTLRSAPHTLGTEAETVLAGAGNILNQPDAIFSQLSNGELPFPSITLSDGTVVKTLDTANYEKYRQAANRDDRKKVFDAFWPVWKSHESTFGATLTTQVMGEVYQAKVRHFPDSLAAATFADNMPESVYKMLVAEANKNLPTMYRYLNLRKRVLGITGDLHYYDIYVPIFQMAQPLHYSVTDAERLTLGATSVYGPEYASLLKKGFSGRWMNVFHHDNEYSGAYMQPGAYDVHPFLLLNYNSDYEALSAFAHEWGHAVHTLLDDETQNFDNSNYSTFTAETASISNEMLLNDYMVAHAKNKQEKLFYLGQGLELIRATFYRQTMFAEFQLAIHQELEKGATLSGERMTDIYCGLLKKYHGDAQGVMKIDPAYCVEWAFVPHFYYGYYVYQYATSMAGAAQFTDAIEHEGKPARDRFIAMLKAGGSDYPYTLYKKAGLDMATPAPYEALVARMNRIMDQIEALEKTK
jgi:oligoendopeptidase F